MKNKAILIIDGLTERRNAMIKAFFGLSDISLYRLELKDSEIALQLYEENLGFWENQVSLPNKVDLMLIHGRDNSYKDFIPAEKRIWYGGYGGKDSIVPEEEESIIRPIEKMKDAISKEEAKELVAFLDGGSQPACLNPDGHIEITEQVLSILKLLLNSNNKDKGQEAVFMEKYNHLKYLRGEELDSVKEKSLRILRSEEISLSQRLVLIRKIRDELNQYIKV